VLLALVSCAGNDGGRPTQSTTLPNETQATLPTTEIANVVEPPMGVGLNEDLLDALGMTFTELVEKYGSPIEVGRDLGNIYFKFENAYGRNAWSYYDSDEDNHEIWVDWDYWWWERTETDNPSQEQLLAVVPRPTETHRCSAIYHVSMNEIFIDISFPSTVSGIVEQYQITHIGSGFTMDGGFISNFLRGNAAIEIVAVNTLEEIVELFDMYEDSRVLTCRCQTSPESRYPCTCGNAEFQEALADVLIFDENTWVSVRCLTITPWLWN